jgi:hypothetical protein
MRSWLRKDRRKRDGCTGWSWLTVSSKKERGDLFAIHRFVARISVQKTAVNRGYRISK